MGKVKKYIKLIILLCTLGVATQLSSALVYAQTIYDSSYVTFSPDGKAFTTNAEDTDIQWYEVGTTVSTGLNSSIRDLEIGEHYYKEPRTDIIPVKEWTVVYEDHRCIHNAGVTEYRELDFTFDKCYAPLYSGWTGTCADCGERFTPMMMYMSKKAAESLDYVDISKEYYYICPYSRNLEMGSGFGEHRCKAISWNQYKIQYYANGATKGFMAPTVHMYNNKTIYEGKNVTPDTKLRKNMYGWDGYEFIGWNTRKNGSGTWYSDGQEVLNLTDKDPGVINLFAQWRRTQNTLQIDPAGGLYGGDPGIFSKTGDYGLTYRPSDRPLVPPAGATVSFDTQGGSSLSPVTGEQRFREWRQESGFQGKFRDGAYTFQGPQGWTDTLTAVYDRLPVTLPAPSRPGYSFSGWYFDPACTRYAGIAGDVLIPEHDLTLYAKWVSLLLTAVNDYTSNDGRGAVDLSWIQPDQTDKTYLLARQRQGEGWIRLLNAAQQSNAPKVQESFPFTQSTGSYTIPYTGQYLLTASGAQGGAYDIYQGGPGGSVSGRFWLQAGEILTYTVGGQNGFNGGGSGDMFAGGGGCTVVTSDRKGTLLVAGGGGGASSMGNGGAGGSSSSVISTGISGENGGAGGGGGYQGGSAGELIQHHHTDACYHVDDLSYVLFDITDWDNNRYLSPWMQDYMNSYAQGKYFEESGSKWEIASGLSGEYYAPSRGLFGSSAHSKGDANSHYYMGQIWGNGRPGTQANGLLPLYIPTNGNTTLNFQAIYEFWGSGGWNLGQSNCISVEDQDGRNIWFKNVKDLPKIEDDAAFRNYNGSCWREGDCKWQEAIPLPAGTTGVTINFNMSVNGGVWFGLDVKRVAFTGGVNRYPICGYTEGQILSSKPAYGGTNYVNTDFCSYYTDEAGRQAGNGSFALSGESLGYQTANSLADVAAPDLAAPDAPDASRAVQTPSGEDRVLIQWEKPVDHGTLYRHQVTSYTVDKAGNLTKSLDSNITENVLTTGVTGYYYKVSRDQNEAPLTGWAYTPAAQPFAEAQLQPYRQYLLVAAADRAGNLSGTAAIPIEAREEPGTVNWPVSTGPVTVDEGENVYRDPGTGAYYVRADGETPVTLAYTGYIHGSASAAYQIGELDFWVEGSVSGDGGAAAGGREVFSVGIPFAAEMTANPIPYEAKDLEKGITEPVYLADASYTAVLRSNRLKDAGLTQRFTVDSVWHGSRLAVTPRAAAQNTRTGAGTWSEEETDRTHGLTILPDACAPEITGTEALEGLAVIDRNAGDLVLTLHAEDDASGLRELTLQVKNQDNFCEQTFYGDGDGNLSLSITQDDYLFYGDFTVTVTATDRVGNVNSELYGTTEFSLDVGLERMMEPHDPVFQSGEAGILTIMTAGYADRVEVQFPKSLALLDGRLRKKVYTYDIPEYTKEERLEFFVPLYAPEGEYTILVSAYKGDRLLQEQPVLFTVKGTILDDFRTRLR